MAKKIPKFDENYEQINPQILTHHKQNNYKEKHGKVCTNQIAKKQWKGKS